MRCYGPATLMRLAPNRLTLLGVLAMQMGAASAHAQDPADASEPTVEADAGIIVEEPFTPDRQWLAHNAELLDELLTRSTQQTIREAKFAAAAGITGGAILFGLATWRLVEDDPGNQYTRGLGVMFMTLGMADLTTGIVAATRISHEKRRSDRWNTARKNGITALELAHFEGELQAANETRQGERLLVRWNGFTHAVAGILVITLTPFPASLGSADKLTGYIIGGVFFATGAAAFGLSFRKTPTEKAWDDYKARKAPTPGHEVSWGIAPAVSRRSFGVSLHGRF